jgi:hypothetical protein
MSTALSAMGPIRAMAFPGPATRGSRGAPWNGSFLSRTNDSSAARRAMASDSVGSGRPEAMRSPWA